MPRCELTFKLLTPDLIVGLDFEVFLFSQSWIPQLLSYLFKEPPFNLGWSECVYVHVTQVFPQTQAFFSNSACNTSVGLTIHL